MTSKVVAVPTAEIAELEPKLNQLLALPAFKDFEVAASFPSSDFTQVVLIFQKP
jgi:hypothetical protein